MNWNSFVPDLVVGIVTGAIVGIALFLVQRRVERRTASSLAQRESVRLVQPLLLALQRKRYNKGLTDVALLPGKHREAFLLINEVQLDEWHETSPTPLTESLIRYRSRLRDWATDAKVLSEAIEFHFARRSAIPALEDWVKAKLLRAGSLELKKITPPGFSYAAFSAQGELALRSKGIGSQASKYRQASIRTGKITDELIPILINHMRASSEAPKKRTAWMSIALKGLLRSLRDPFALEGNLPRVAFWPLVVGGLVVMVLVYLSVAELWRFVDSSVGVAPHLWLVEAPYAPPTLRALSLVATTLLLDVCLAVMAGAVRRLRDAGRAAPWLLLLLLPVVGWVLLCRLLVLPSSGVLSRNTD